MLAINQRTQNIALLMIFATIGVFSGVLLTRTGETLDAKPAIPDDIPADARIRYVIDHQSDEEHVFAMHWSAAGDLWFVGSRSDGLLSLNRYDPRTSQHDRWELPGEASPGPYTYLVEHSDGSWWVAANYTLWRFDPRSEDAVVHEVLEQAHPLRLPEADDRGTPLPGTWITGMVANGDGVALARHNVPALFHVDANGDIRTLASLDAPPKGLTTIADTPVAFRELGETLSSDAHVGLDLQDTAGVRYAERRGCAATLIPELNQVLIRSGDVVSEVPGVVTPYDDQVSVSIGGNFWSAALSEEATILRGQCSSTAVERIQLPVMFFSPSEPPVGARGGSLWENLQRDHVASRITVLALAVSDTGEVAFSDHTMRIGIVE